MSKIRGGTWAVGLARYPGHWEVDWGEETKRCFFDHEYGTTWKAYAHALQFRDRVSHAGRAAARLGLASEGPLVWAEYRIEVPPRGNCPGRRETWFRLPGFSESSVPYGALADAVRACVHVFHPDALYVANFSIGQRIEEGTTYERKMAAFREWMKVVV